MAAKRPNDIRLRHLYRRMILTGKARIPVRRAIRMVGPDCAYHLYRHFKPSSA